MATLGGLWDTHVGHATLAAEAAFPTTAPRSPLDADAAREYLRRCSRIIQRHAAALTRLDEALGDGDHGDNLVTGFAAVLEQISTHSSGESADDLPTLLRSVGASLVANVGGASGPLYGAAFAEAGFAAGRLNGEDRTASLAILVSAAAAGLARRGHCRVGDKTIYDTLAPAALALRAAADGGADEATALREMVQAGARGMRSTTALIARRGLALRLGERSRGHRDPGAASCLLLLKALAAKGVGVD
jgi:phosphoenolpyruvate---glycerone phosphotransferase subunit DhaL